MRVEIGSMWMLLKFSCMFELIQNSTTPEHSVHTSFHYEIILRNSQRQQEEKISEELIFVLNQRYNFIMERSWMRGLCKFHKQELIKILYSHSLH